MLEEEEEGLIGNEGEYCWFLRGPLLSLSCHRRCCSCYCALLIYLKENEERGREVKRGTGEM